MTKKRREKRGGEGKHSILTQHYKNRLNVYILGGFVRRLYQLQC